VSGGMSNRSWKSIWYDLARWITL